VAGAIRFRMGRAARSPRRSQLFLVEIRTVAGPSSVVQCVLSGGPYTVSPHMRHVQVVCPTVRVKVAPGVALSG
jgi:hypothetical protein